IKAVQVQDLPLCNSSARRCQKPCQEAPWDEGIQVSCLWGGVCNEEALKYTLTGETRSWNTKGK
ncbi:hypothetical protein JRQ81_012526, partial [Phrynocephalus forsythii]